MAIARSRARQIAHASSGAALTSLARPKSRPRRQVRAAWGPRASRQRCAARVSGPASHAMARRNAAASLFVVPRAMGWPRKGAPLAPANTSPSPSRRKTGAVSTGTVAAGTTTAAHRPFASRGSAAKRTATATTTASAHRVIAARADRSRRVIDAAARTDGAIAIGGTGGAKSANPCDRIGRIRSGGPQGPPASYLPGDEADLAATRYTPAAIIYRSKSTSGVGFLHGTMS
jgi:hypothetical protein